MKISIVTDIHHGPISRTKRGDQALVLLENFVDAVNVSPPDLVIDLGDRITDVDPEADRRAARDVAEALMKIKVPLVSVHGNHDLVNLSLEENAEILGQSPFSETLDVGGWRVVVWRADAVYGAGPGGTFALPEPDFRWLWQTLNDANRPLLIVSHVPVSGHSQIGNCYFESAPDRATYPEAQRIRALLSATVVPVVWLAGHVHRNTLMEVDGVFHLTQQSLTESCMTDGKPAAAWGHISFDEQVTWQVLGGDPIELKFMPRVRSTLPLGQRTDGSQRRKTPVAPPAAVGQGETFDNR